MSEPRKQRQIRATRHDTVLDACRDTALVIIDAQFIEMFDHCDAVLLDFAERAENNALQGRFFEAMNLLQRRRADIEHTFRVEINRGFERFARYGRLTDEDGGFSADGIELALIEPEDMEESVACENLTMRANASFFPDLYALAQRLAVVNGGLKLKDSEIPAGPHHLVRSFRRSLESLDVEVKIKVILYALFDRFVIRQLTKVYDELNRHLKEAGILPNLKPVPLRTDGGSAQRPRPTAAGDDKPTPKDASGAKAKTATAAHRTASPDGGHDDQPSLANELFGSILDLMAKRRPDGEARAAPDLDAPSNPQLLSAISRIQSLSRADLGSAAGGTEAFAPDVEVDAAFLDRVKMTLADERRQIREQVDETDLSAVDSDLIDLIGMLFEYMLNDPILPNSAKALLSHLHTPYLKVALIDRRMLVDNRHPARHLLDQMIEAGSLWVEEGNPNRGIFPAMRRTVDRVLMEFDDDIALFDELLADFEAAVQEQRRRIETMEQRSQDTLRGRERLQVARQKTMRTVQELIGRRPLPDAVLAFLSGAWTDHLVFTSLREPEQGEGWQRAIAMAEKLVDLFDPRREAASAEAIGAVRDAIRAQTQTMDDVHRDTIEGLLALLDQPPAQWPRPTPGTPPTPDEAASPEAAHDAGLPPSEALAMDDEDEDDDVSDEEKALLEELRQLRFGTWLELTPSDGGRPRHIKLSWMSPLTSTCMFVDRSGMQAEVKGLRELAQEILAGRARIVPPPKHPFIDRALMSIRKVLGGGDKGDAALPQTDRAP